MTFLFPSPFNDIVFHSKNIRDSIRGLDPSSLKVIVTPEDQQLFHNSAHRWSTECLPEIMKNKKTKATRKKKTEDKTLDKIANKIIKKKTKEQPNKRPQ